MSEAYDKDSVLIIEDTSGDTRQISSSKGLYVFFVSEAETIAQNLVNEPSEFYQYQYNNAVATINISGKSFDKPIMSLLEKNKYNNKIESYFANYHASAELELIKNQTASTITLTGNLGKYQLNKDLNIFILFDSEQFIGEIPSLELYAFGDSRAEVISELKQDIIDLYEDLIDKPQEILGPEPKKWKKILEKIIVDR